MPAIPDFSGSAWLGNKADNDLQFCWQLVMRVRPGFRLSHAYAPREYSAGLLALYAWFSALEEALCRVSDESVGRAKLLWWQQQLLGPDYGISSHPITRQLHRRGVIPTSAREHVQVMLESALHRLDAPPASDEKALRSLCQSLGFHAMCLELAIQHEENAESPVLAGACAVNGLVQLLRESSRSELPSYTWLPLKLLARHDLTRAELQSKTRSEATRLLMQQLCTLGLTWIEGKDFGNDLSIDASWRCRHRHWIIQTLLNVRCLKRLQRMNLQLHSQEFSTVLVGDAWLSWRTARKLSKRSASK